MRYSVPVCRELLECCDVEVEADSLGEAIDKAIVLVEADTGLFELAEIYPPFVISEKLVDCLRGNDGQAS